MRQTVSIKHVNVPIDEILWHLIRILLRNRAIFKPQDFSMSFNIDTEQKWFQRRDWFNNVHGSIPSNEKNENENTSYVRTGVVHRIISRRFLKYFCATRAY